MDQVREFVPVGGAGVLIEIVKVDNIFKFGDEEMDYAFSFAKAIGGRAISTEIAKTEAELKRLGNSPTNTEFNVGYHGHGTTTPEHWEAAFALAKHNCANVDLGHFVAGNNISPVPFIEKCPRPHHPRPPQGPHAPQRSESPVQAKVIPRSQKSSASSATRNGTFRAPSSSKSKCPKRSAWKRSPARSNTAVMRWREGRFASSEPWTFSSV